MIFINKKDIGENSFVVLLETTKNKIIQNFKNKIPRKINGNIFEDIVYQKMVLSSIGTSFEGYVEQTGAHAFPDIIARQLYGVEVKMTVDDKWISTGNSVLESTRIDGVETIYMFFGKFGNSFDIKYRKYQECLCEVGVTHSPRYKIDMNLSKGESIFDKMGVEYNSFRKKSNPIKLLKDYYRKQLKDGEELWWIDNGTENRIISPIIQSFSMLDKSIRDYFISESMILFPEIFGNSTIKFERVAAYLIINYNAVSSSLRDNFTAGGRIKISIKGKDVVVSRVVYNLFERAKQIENIINKISKEKLSYYWGLKVDKKPIETWKILLKRYSIEPIDIVSIYNEGLKNE